MYCDIYLSKNLLNLLQESSSRLLLVMPWYYEVPPPLPVLPNLNKYKYIYLIFPLHLRYSSGQKKGPFAINTRYRCNHNTRYHGTSDMKSVQQFKPSKQRSKNTSCPFFLTVKVKRQVSLMF